MAENLEGNLESEYDIDRSVVSNDFLLEFSLISGLGLEASQEAYVWYRDIINLRRVSFAYKNQKNKLGVENNLY
jgi:hypothetical protein